MKESSYGDSSGIYHEGEMAIGPKIADGLLHYFNNNEIVKRTIKRFCCKVFRAELNCRKIE
ncbi:hypothetical protein, partial [Bacillus toyonensis]